MTKLLTLRRLSYLPLAAAVAGGMAMIAAMMIDHVMRVVIAILMAGG